MITFNNFLPVEEKPRKWVAIGITTVIAWLLTAWGVYVIGEYGFALFILTPLFIGAASTILYGCNRQVARRELRNLSFRTLGIFMAGLLITAMEGVICVIMAIPIAILLVWLGYLLGYAIIKRTGNTTILLLLLTCSIPALSFVEKNYPPSLTAITSSIEIKASPETVWKNMIAFQQLPEPTDLIFRMGIAYPVNATVQGKGVGAVRHCNFSTGSFVEPVTVWDEPRLLRFRITEQPAPMKELSLWNINAPHLNGYFVSKQGQFRLTLLPNGNTLLEGTSWYSHDIKPAFYWRLWSTFIIHKIHLRVLGHIKEESEK